MNPDVRRRETVDPKIKCCMCGRAEINDVEWGDMYELEGVVVHYFCLLFSAGIKQSGEDNEGILGFLPKDIKAEMKRGSKLRCRFCKGTKATVGCTVTRCRQSCHYPCALENKWLFQFFGRFDAFCSNHKTNQIIPAEADITCPICYTETEDLTEAVFPPCCGKSVFHRRCMMHAAKRAGYFFKCPLCNASDKFLRAMQENGVFIPQEDAAWELEPNAYSGQDQHYSKCDADPCVCPRGKEHNSNSDREWKIIRCGGCGSAGIHVACGKLELYSWKCQTCDEIFNPKAKLPVPTSTGDAVPGVGSSINNEPQSDKSSEENSDVSVSDPPTEWEEAFPRDRVIPRTRRVALRPILPSDEVDNDTSSDEDYNPNAKPRRKPGTKKPTPKTKKTAGKPKAKTAVRRPRKPTFSIYYKLQKNEGASSDSNNIEAAGPRSIVGLNSINKLIDEINNGPSTSADIIRKIDSGNCPSTSTSISHIDKSSHSGVSVSSVRNKDTREAACTKLKDTKDATSADDGSTFNKDVRPKDSNDESKIVNASCTSVDPSVITERRDPPGKKTDVISTNEANRVLAKATPESSTGTDTVKVSSKKSEVNSIEKPKDTITGSSTRDIQQKKSTGTNTKKTKICETQPKKVGSALRRNEIGSTSRLSSGRDSTKFRLGSSGKKVPATVTSESDASKVPSHVGTGVKGQEKIKETDRVKSGGELMRSLSKIPLEILNGMRIPKKVPPSEATNKEQPQHKSVSDNSKPNSSVSQSASTERKASDRVDNRTSWAGEKRPRNHNSFKSGYSKEQRRNNWKSDSRDHRRWNSYHSQPNRFSRDNYSNRQWSNNSTKAVDCSQDNYSLERWVQRNTTDQMNRVINNYHGNWAGSSRDYGYYPQVPAQTLTSANYPTIIPRQSLFSGASFPPNGFSNNFLSYPNNIPVCTITKPNTPMSGTSYDLQGQKPDPPSVPIEITIDASDSNCEQEYPNVEINSTIPSGIINQAPNNPVSTTQLKSPNNTSLDVHIQNLPCTVPNITSNPPDKSSSIPSEITNETSNDIQFITTKVKSLTDRSSDLQKRNLNLPANSIQTTSGSSDSNREQAGSPAKKSSAAIPTGLRCQSHNNNPNPKPQTHGSASFTSQDKFAVPSTSFKVTSRPDSNRERRDSIAQSTSSISAEVMNPTYLKNPLFNKRPLPLSFTPSNDSSVQRKRVKLYSRPWKPRVRARSPSLLEGLSDISLNLFDNLNTNTLTSNVPSSSGQSLSQSVPQHMTSLQPETDEVIFVPTEPNMGVELPQIQRTPEQLSEQAQPLDQGQIAQTSSVQSQLFSRSQPLNENQSTQEGPSDQNQFLTDSITVQQAGPRSPKPPQIEPCIELIDCDSDSDIEVVNHIPAVRFQENPESVPQSDAFKNMLCERRGDGEPSKQIETGPEVIELDSDGELPCIELGSDSEVESGVIRNATSPEKIPDGTGTESG